MNSDRPDVKTIFGHALEIEAPADRAAYLDQACGADAGLRTEVEALLAVLDRAGEFMRQPVAATGATAGYTPPVEGSGSRVGPYKLLQPIGEGGMGVVYMAEQEEPVRRKVAVKIIKPGMDSGQVVARFEAERQALAMMDHANIARVFEAGTTDSGRPYFVMELVHGVPITEYCDANTLTPRQRLELFVPVCHAVQHAHQKGIIHRDIKPSNILVTMYDDKPVPKVIDFGVAKAIEQRLTEKTLFTQFGTMVGTFEYMSPEQAEMNAFGVDTRSDIYSLGVLLYELLTGTTPLERKRLRSAAFDEIRRIIRDEEPPRPSVRLSTSGMRAKVAAARQTEPAKLSRLVRGELDWLVMRCLEKDRARRYETANALARDVQRFLDDEPVEACPPSARYRLKKLLRRNKVPLLVTAVVFMALLVGLAGTTWGLVAARAATGQERKAKQTAQKRLEQLGKANDVVAAILADIDPGAEEKGGRPLRAILRDRLDRAAAELDAEAVGDPRTVASLQHTLGESLVGLGESRQAVPLLERAVATRQAELGDDHPDTLRSRFYLWRAVRHESKWGLARSQLERLLPACEAVLGNDDKLTLQVRNDLAVIYSETGQFRLAIPLLQRVLAERAAKFGADHDHTLTTQVNLADAHMDAGETRVSVELLERAVAAYVGRYGDDYGETLWARLNLALAYYFAGESKQAMPLFEQTLKACEAKFGDDAKITLKARGYLAMAYRDEGDLDRAIALFQRNLKSAEIKFGPDHYLTYSTRASLAVAYASAGKLDLAIPLIERAASGYEALYGDDHPQALKLRSALATMYSKDGRQDRAVALFERTLKTQETILGDDHPETLETRNNLGVAYVDAGKADLARRFLEPTLEARKVKLGENHPSTLQSMHNLAITFARTRQFDRALPLYEQTLAMKDQKLGLNHPDTLLTVDSLASAYRDAGKYPESVRLLKRLHTAQVRKLGPDDPQTVITLGHLAMVSMQAGEPEAIRMLEEARDIQVRVLGQNHQKTLTTLNELGVAYWRKRQFAKAVEIFTELLKRRRAKYGDDHHEVFHAAFNLGVNYREANRVDDAVKLFDEWLPRASKTLPADDPALSFGRKVAVAAYDAAERFDRVVPLLKDDITAVRPRVPKDDPGLAVALAALGSAQLQAKQFNDAEPTLRECVTIRREKQADDWRTFNTESMLGESLLRQSKYADAESLLIQGYEGLKKREAQIPAAIRQVRLIEALERLVNLYDRWDKPAEAAKWRSELAAKKK